MGARSVLVGWWTVEMGRASRSRRDSVRRRRLQTAVSSPASHGRDRSTGDPTGLPAGIAKGRVDPSFQGKEPLFAEVLAEPARRTTAGAGEGLDLPDARSALGALGPAVLAVLRFHEDPS